MAPLPRPCSLSAFVAAQQLRIEDVQELLENDWTMRTIGLVDRLVPIARTAQQGPGAEGGEQEEVDPAAEALMAAEMEAAQVSKVQGLRFIKMLSILMADQLRSAVLGSVKAYRAFWEQFDWPPGSDGARAGFPDNEHLPPAIAGPDGSSTTVAAHQQGQAPDPASPNALFRATHAISAWGGDFYIAATPPLFMQHLVVKDRAIRLEPSVEDVETAVMESYDEIIRATHRVDDISIKVGAGQQDLLACLWMRAQNASRADAAQGPSPVCQAVPRNLPSVAHNACSARAGDERVNGPEAAQPASGRPCGAGSSCRHPCDHPQEP